MMRREQPLKLKMRFPFPVAKSCFVHRRRHCGWTNHFGKCWSENQTWAGWSADIKPSIRGEALSFLIFAHLSDTLVKQVTLIQKSPLKIHWDFYIREKGDFEPSRLDACIVCILRDRIIIRKLLKIQELKEIGCGLFWIRKRVCFCGISGLLAVRVHLQENQLYWQVSCSQKWWCCIPDACARSTEKKG